MSKKQVIEKIGKQNWKAFEEFVLGQTIGINPDSSEDFYKGDVEASIKYAKNGICRLID